MSPHSKELPDVSFVKDGPAIPGEVIAAQEKGRLAFICGAGISVPNGLPLFDELVYSTWKHIESSINIRSAAALYECGNSDDAYKLLGSDRFQNVLEALANNEFDRALGCLEEHYTCTEVRRAVQDILSSPNQGASTDTHNALIDLATTKRGTLQLVTTNFDLLFESGQQHFNSFSAPALPVPKHKRWNSLVYLHGKIDEETDSEGQHLVLTSADFGRAYLTEQWASHFLRDLFRNYTVVFVGYSLSDPVMRYLLDALAADRKLFKAAASPAYSFVSFGDTESEDEVVLNWKGKHVVPIPYHVKNDHELLHQTLHKWADAWRGGVTARKNVVNELGQKDPSALSVEEHNRFIWAISDLDVIKYVAEQLRADVHINWLKVLASRNGWLRNTVVSRDEVAIVDDGYASYEPPRLERRYHFLTQWMVSYIGSERTNETKGYKIPLKELELTRILIRRGAHLHPDFRSQIDPFEAAEPALETIWQILKSPELLTSPRNDYINSRSLADQIGKFEWSPWLRQRVLHAMEPVIILQAYSSTPHEFFEDGTHSERLDVAHIAHPKFKLRSGSLAQSVLQALDDHNNIDEIYSQLALAATGLLRTAVDILLMLNKSDELHDIFQIIVPSIDPHSQNEFADEWVYLVEFCRNAFNGLLNTDRSRAEQLLDQWSAIPYPIFRRLTLYGTQQLA